ncbi:MAG TPA: flagellar motor protein MotB [Gaiellaceae bacterium]|jgi:chemotaxis protein MotB|nr:flagellar motor protein MotB [Gaiellaceae bacterium]
MSSHGGSRRGGAHAEEHADERWLLTYSDMITLLMALFIVMWAVSSVNTTKFAQLKASLHSAFSGKVLENPGAVLTGSTAPFDQPGTPITPINPSTAMSGQAFSMTRISSSITQSAQTADLENLKALQRRVRQYAAAHGFAQDVATTIQERGLVVHVLTDGVLFDSGSAVLKPAGLTLLKEIGHLVDEPDIVNPVSVEGNTDSMPIHSALYPSNWELSTARANAVLEFLLGAGLKESRASVVGYGSQKPLASNSTASGRRRNRRVDIVILRRTFQSPKGVS